MTRKITMALTNILAGKQKKLYLGNLDAKRDWGFAPEYIQCMWMMLQQDTPEDYVIGTGESHSVREFVENVFSYAGIEIEWKGKDADQKGFICSLDSTLNSTLKLNDILIEIDPKYFRPTEVDFLLADISKAKKKLGWEPKISFKDLVKIMVDCDLEHVGLSSKGEGKKILEEKNINWTKNKLAAG